MASWNQFRHRGATLGSALPLPQHSCFRVLSPQEGNNPQALPQALPSGNPGRGDKPQQTPPQLQASSTHPLRAERIPPFTPRPQPESQTEVPALGIQLCRQLPPPAPPSVSGHSLPFSPLSLSAHGSLCRHALPSKAAIDSSLNNSRGRWRNSVNNNNSSGHLGRLWARAITQRN